MARCSLERPDPPSVMRKTRQRISPHGVWKPAMENWRRRVGLHDVLQENGTLAAHVGHRSEHDCLFSGPFMIQRVLGRDAGARPRGGEEVEVVIAAEHRLGRRVRRDNDGRERGRNAIVSDSCALMTRSRSSSSAGSPARK
jgi:hypothetical protein